jgi:5-methylcytosine-specific restriction protein A
MLTTLPALFLNGVFESVLENIREVQEAHPGKTCYLQPYKNSPIRLLADEKPTFDHPMALYISLTDSLDRVSYRAEIVGWRDKRDLAKDPHSLATLNQHITAFQPGESEIYLKLADGKPCVNLIEVVGVKKLKESIPVSCFVKISDGKPLGIRSRSGGWSPVYQQPEWLGELPQIVRDELQTELEKGVARSLNDNPEARRLRLEAAPRIPPSVQVISKAYRRNPDVIAEVLWRAAGDCEKCLSPAPFMRAANGSPFLEVHHKKMLAEGGEDSVENAIALCPNCHRRFHFGMPEPANVG